MRRIKTPLTSHLSIYHTGVSLIPRRPTEIRLSAAVTVSPYLPAMIEERMAPPEAPPLPDLKSPALYINRAAAPGSSSTAGCCTRRWIRAIPLLERLKFLGIFTSNLDEFFKERVGADSAADGRPASVDADARRADARNMQPRRHRGGSAAACWREHADVLQRTSSFPAWPEHGIELLSDAEELDPGDGE